MSGDRRRAQAGEVTRAGEREQRREHGHGDRAEGKRGLEGLAPSAHWDDEQKRHRDHDRVIQRGRVFRRVPQDHHGCRQIEGRDQLGARGRGPHHQPRGDGHDHERHRVVCGERAQEHGPLDGDEHRRRDPSRLGAVQTPSARVGQRRGHEHADQAEEPRRDQTPDAVDQRRQNRVDHRRAREIGWEPQVWSAVEPGLQELVSTSEVGGLIQERGVAEDQPNGQERLQRQDRSERQEPTDGPRALGEASGPARQVAARTAGAPLVGNRWSGSRLAPELQATPGQPRQRTHRAVSGIGQDRYASHGASVHTAVLIFDRRSRFTERGALGDSTCRFHTNLLWAPTAPSSCTA